MLSIPISKPYIGDLEKIAVSKVLDSGWLTQGTVVAQFEENFSLYVKSKYACAVSNCTSGMQLGLLAMGVKPGNVVITVSHSFIATSNAVRHCGAEPAFVDVDSSTFNMDPKLLKEFIDQNCISRNNNLYLKGSFLTPHKESPLKNYRKDNIEYGKISAILAVHQIGIPCEIEEIAKIGHSYGLPVMEDAACAIGSEILNSSGNYDRVGKCHGDLVCFSFHPRKVLTTGEGGMITTNNSDFDATLRLLRHQGMNLSDSIRHQAKDEVLIEKYVVTGYNDRMSDIQAAIGVEQLKRLPDFLRKRRELVGYYYEFLSGTPGINLLNLPSKVISNWQSFPIILSKKAPYSRNQLMNLLLKEGVSSRPGVMNAHEETPYMPSPYSLPNSENIRKSSILLPIFHEMDRSVVERVCQALKKYLIT